MHGCPCVIYWPNAILRYEGVFICNNYENMLELLRNENKNFIINRLPVLVLPTPEFLAWILPSHGSKETTSVIVLEVTNSTNVKCKMLYMYIQGSVEQRGCVAPLTTFNPRFDSICVWIRADPGWPPRVHESVFPKKPHNHQRARATQVNSLFSVLQYSTFIVRMDIRDIGYKQCHLKVPIFSPLT